MRNALKEHPYHNRKNDVRIRCEQIQSLVISRVKNYVSEHAEFEQLVESAVKKRQTTLPKLEAQIGAAMRDLKKMDESEDALRKSLLEINEGAVK